MTRLRLAASAGRLLAEELDERLAVAFSARTYGQLDVIVADLPRERRSWKPILAKLAGRRAALFRLRPRALLATSAGGVTVAAVVASLSMAGGAAPRAVSQARVSAASAAHEHPETRCPSYPPPAGISCFFTGSLKAAQDAARQSPTGTVPLPLRAARRR